MTLNSTLRQSQRIEKLPLNSTLPLKVALLTYFVILKPLTLYGNSEGSVSNVKYHRIYFPSDLNLHLSLSWLPNCEANDVPNVRGVLRGYLRCREQ